MPTLRYRVSIFDRHTVDEQRRADAKRYDMIRTDLCMVSVDWPIGRHVQYYADMTKDGKITYNPIMEYFLTKDDVAKIKEEARLVVEMLKNEPDIARHYS